MKKTILLFTIAVGCQFIYSYSSASYSTINHSPNRRHAAIVKNGIKQTLTLFSGLNYSTQEYSLTFSNSAGTYSYDMPAAVSGTNGYNQFLVPDGLYTEQVVPVAWPHFTHVGTYLLGTVSVGPAPRQGKSLIMLIYQV